MKAHHIGVTPRKKPFIGPFREHYKWLKKKILII